MELLSFNELMGSASTYGMALAIIFFLFQAGFFIGTLIKLSKLSDFFPENPGYAIIKTERGHSIVNVDEKKYPKLFNLIKELNEYVGKTRGTTDFAIIQNKTERELNTLVEEATSKVTFPTYIGLMGTFAGVFLGLYMFNNGIAQNGTNLPIYQLISGVLVSMSTSFIGLLFTTINNARASSVLKNVDDRKNRFYDFLQNELMPTLDTSMVVALNKLHETVNLMQPSFTAAIDQFKEAFKLSTEAFGKDFRASVNELNQAVNVMRNGLNSINQNIEGQKELIESLKSDRFIGVLSAFVDTADYFNKVVERLNEVTQYTSQITSATKQLIDTQQAYNQSLQIPTNLFNEINNLLNRVKRFEQSMNEIGETIKKNQIWGMEFAQTLKLHTDTIAKNSRQIDAYLDTSGNKIEKIFKGQEAKMEILSKAHERALEGFYEKVKEILDNQANDLKTKHEEFARKLDEVFNFDDVHDEFESLKKLNSISFELTQLRAQFETIFKKDDVQNQLINIRKLQSIQEALDKIKDAIEKQFKNLNSGQNSVQQAGNKTQQSGQQTKTNSVQPDTDSNPYAKVARRMPINTGTNGTNTSKGGEKGTEPFDDGKGSQGTGSTNTRGGEMGRDDEEQKQTGSLYNQLPSWLKSWLNKL